MKNKYFQPIFLSLILLSAISLKPVLVNSQNLIRNSSLLSQQENKQKAKVREVVSVGMTVSDMERTIQFYSRVLSFKKISDVEVWGKEYENLQGLFGLRMRIVKMQLGEEIIELTDYLTAGGRPIPIDSRSNDRWFQHIAIVVSDMDRAYEILHRNRVEQVSPAPQRLPDYIPAAAGIQAFYFRDPDGHNLELIYYPPGKGDSRWQGKKDKLFLGIDHTAIGISNTPNSLKFYRDLLGLRVVGESHNFGNEQEHLNNVLGAKLHISGLKAERGLGIEFLEYLNPQNGRSFPVDSRTDDLLHWETTLLVEDASEIATRLRIAGYSFISSDIVIFKESLLGFRKSFLVRDPDGHVIKIIER
jgi:catechol 2,3-dioxygenase-like lactoylglutathione lyase family enzyme